MDTANCKICRKVGKKLFLKGDRCFSPKCAILKRPSPPGPEPKRGATITDYGREFMEKQKMKHWYGLRESQFKKYVKGVLTNLNKINIPAEDALIRKLELRLDNVIFRMGLATSIAQARRLVSHGHIAVNGRKLNIPSYEAKKGDKISVKENSKNKAYFQKVSADIKKYKAPVWIKLDANNLEGEISGMPQAQEVGLPIQLSSIFEFYSK